MIDPAQLRVLYKITNTINGKIYFGITKCGLSRRWASHKHSAISQKKKTHLYSAMLKYGIENFKIEEVAKYDTDELLYKAEIDAIRTYKSNDGSIGYNNSTGGEVSSKGRKWRQESREKLSLSQIGKKRGPASEETKMKLRKAAKGRTLPYKAIMAAAKKRIGLPAYNSCKVHQYDLSGNYITTFSSQRAAAKSVGGVNAFSLIKKGRLKTYKGYKWTFEN